MGQMAKEGGSKEWMQKKGASMSQLIKYAGI